MFLKRPTGHQQPWYWPSSARISYIYCWWVNLDQAMAWCHLAPCHYLIQCWPISIIPYGASRPEWVKHCPFPSTMTATKTDHRMILDSPWSPGQLQLRNNYGLYYHIIKSMPPNTKTFFHCWNQTDILWCCHVFIMVVFISIWHSTISNSFYISYLERYDNWLSICCVISLRI